MKDRLEDFSVSIRCVQYCELVGQNTWEETQRKTPEYLSRKVTEVLKEGGTEWSADRSAGSDCEWWKVRCKPSASVGRKGSTN